MSYPNGPEEKTICCNEYIQTWFGLSYCSYLVLPRSILQSMPEGWQKKFVELLEEAGRLYECPESGLNYTVYTRDKAGKFHEDVYKSYERGRRIIDPNTEVPNK